MHGSDTDSWDKLVALKQKQIADDIPLEWRLPSTLVEKYRKPGFNLIASDILQSAGFLSPVELQITETKSATEIARQLKTGELSSVAVTTAFSKRAAIAQQLTSCLTETMFPEALERAKYLDDYLKLHGKPMGPLHGLPISIKDCFKVVGKQSTVGYVEFIKHPAADENSPLVEMLLELGAVLYVKTNIPQTMMTGDSDNNIFGRTLNPHNTSLTAGGSSGGEGALVAFKGSPLGVGTDVAGSIRIPSLCCGTYGFKPTADRVPYGGQVSGAMEGLPGIHPSAGPLANSLGDLEFFTSSVLSTETWKYDVTAIGASWNSTPRLEDGKKLRIGVMDEHPLLPLHPPVRRALQSAVQALAAAGHEIVRITQDGGRDIALGNRLAFQYFTYAPHPDQIAASGEPPVPSVAKRAHPMFTGPFLVSPELSDFELINELQNARDQYSDAWRKTWVAHKLDVMLGPPAQNTAVPYDTFGWPPYTLFLNLIDYPACIIPYGTSDKNLDSQAFSPADDVQPSYDPEATHGAPCSVQVFTPRFQDEQCLAAARVIDRVLHPKPR